MKRLNNALMFLNVVGFCFVAGAAILLCSKGLLVLAALGIAMSGYVIPKLAPT